MATALEATTAIQDKMFSALQIGQKAMLDGVKSWAETVETVYAKLPDLMTADPIKPTQFMETTLGVHREADEPAAGVHHQAVRGHDPRHPGHHGGHHGGHLRTEAQGPYARPATGAGAPAGAPAPDRVKRAKVQECQSARSDQTIRGRRSGRRSARSCGPSGAWPTCRCATWRSAPRCPTPISARSSAASTCRRCGCCARSPRPSTSRPRPCWPRPGCSRTSLRPTTEPVGLRPPSPPSGGDPKLTSDQKEALLSVYRSYLASNRGA